MSDEFPVCLRLYNASVRLLNSPDLPYECRCSVKGQVLFYEMQCVRCGVWDV